MVAERLHAKMQHLGPEGEDWDPLTDQDKEAYRLCIEHLTEVPAMIWLSLYRTRNYVVARRAKVGKQPDFHNKH